MIILVFRNNDFKSVSSDQAILPCKRIHFCFHTMESAIFMNLADKDIQHLRTTFKLYKQSNSLCPSSNPNTYFIIMKLKDQ